MANEGGPPPRKLTSIEVDSLLYGLHHHVDFPREWEFVILYGPNGVGKTRLLELVKAVVGFDYGPLADTPFRELRLTYDDGSQLRASKKEIAGEDDVQQCTITLQLSGAHEPIVYDIWQDPTSNFKKYLLDNTTFRPISANRWEDSTDGEIVTLQELLERFDLPVRHRRRGKQSLEGATAPDELRAFCESVPVHLIETQRLLALDDQVPPHLRSPMYTPYGQRYVQWRRTVTQYSDHLKRQLAEALTANSRLSQQLDRTFPRRIMEAAPPSGVTERDVRDKYETQNTLRTRLARFNLISAEGDVPLPERNLDPFEVKALWVYLQDTDQKLSSFEPLLERLELFMSLLTGRLVRKTLSIGVDDGLTILRDDTGERVGAERLSSGEQHELVLVYDLLFRTRPGSTVLIDEPEISLHVAWQQQFLTDIQSIAKLADLRFIIATHSPQIIDKWWDHTSALELETS